MGKSTSETDSGEKDSPIPEDQTNYKFDLEEEVLVVYNALQHKERWYRSKIIKRKVEKSKTDPDELKIKYFVHYLGWNHRWDVWQPEMLVKKASPENIEYSQRMMQGEFDAPEESPPKKAKTSIKRESMDSPPVGAAKVKNTSSTNKHRSQSGATAIKLTLNDALNENQTDFLTSTPAVPQRTKHRSAETHNKMPGINQEIYDNLAVNKLSAQLLVKKCDKSEAKESFHKDDENFDVVEAPLGSDDVLRGDNFDIQLTTELMAEVEKEMMKMRTYTPSLPCKVSMLDIFDNYIHWHYLEEILKDNGISRQTQMFNDELSSKETRSYRIQGIPLSYAQELNRAIQICQTFINLMYDYNWFFCNLLYDNEVPVFRRILKSVKWANLEPENAPGKSDRTAKRKTTRSNVLVEQCTIRRQTLWFLKRSPQEMHQEAEQNLFEKESHEDLSWFFTQPKNHGQENLTFLRPNFSNHPSRWITPGVPHIYGGRHLLRFFSHWIYKAGFVDRIFKEVLKDWQMEAIEGQMESIMKFMFLHKEHCLPSLESDYDRVSTF